MYFPQVRWAGCAEDEDTWEPMSKIAPQLVAAFHTDNPATEHSAPQPTAPERSGPDPSTSLLPSAPEPSVPGVPPASPASPSKRGRNPQALSPSAKSPAAKSQALPAVEGDSNTQWCQRSWISRSGAFAQMHRETQRANTVCHAVRTVGCRYMCACVQK